MTTPGRGPLRRGVSLAEMLVAMSCASVVVAGATALVHRTLSLEATSRRVLERERAALTLARRFRADVHEASKVRCSQDAIEEPFVLFLETAGGRSIRYESTATGIARMESDATGSVWREDWRFAGDVRWTSIRHRGLVSLVAAVDGPSGPAFEATAAFGSRRFPVAGGRP